MNLFTFKTLVLVSLLAASTQVNAADAPKKNSVAKTEEKKPKSPVATSTEGSATYTDLLPSANSQIPVVADQPSVEAEAQKIKDSRWVDQKQLQPTTNEVPKDKEESRVKLTAKCTDKSGRSFASGEAGYDTCLMQMRENSRDSEAKKGTKNSNDASGAGTGFEIKFP